MRERKTLWRYILLAAVLAVLCIGGVELAACRHFAPETYESIVAPVRHAAAVTVDACRAGLNAAGQFCRETAASAAEAAGRLADQAAEAWKEATAPKEILLVVDETPAPADHFPVGTEPPLTEALEREGRQVLTGGVVEVTYFCQADEEWAEQPYGTDPIGPYGCGPTAMAIAVASLTETDTDPAKMAAWAAEHGYWARGSGSYHSIVRGTAAAFGLRAEPLAQRTEDQLTRALWEGKMLVALMGPGHFTTGGHFIVLRGITLQGKVLVADPNSLERSLEAWDPQIILDELSSARDNGAPLWVLSVRDT